MMDFHGAHPQLRDDVALHVQLQFRRRIVPTRRIIRRPGMADADPELIDGAADFLMGIVAP